MERMMSVLSNVECKVCVSRMVVYDYSLEKGSLIVCSNQMERRRKTGDFVGNDRKMRGRRAGGEDTRKRPEVAYRQE